MTVRRTLRTRTLFNLLGPLVNPARPEFQVMGIYTPHLCRPAAETLGLLGCRAALVVHGSGLDELALHGPTTAALLREGRVETLTIHPDDAGLGTAPVQALAGAGPDAAARWLRRLVAGHGDQAHVDAVALNAGAVVWIAGQATSLREGVAAARDALRSGAAGSRLTLLVEASHGH